MVLSRRVLPVALCTSAGLPAHSPGREDANTLLGGPGCHSRCLFLTGNRAPGPTRYVLGSIAAAGKDSCVNGTLQCGNARRGVYVDDIGCRGYKRGTPHAHKRQQKTAQQPTATVPKPSKTLILHLPQAQTKLSYQTDNMKSAAILAAVAACASAASVHRVVRESCQDMVFQTLSNPSTGRCIVYTSYDSDADEYTLSLGDCGSDADGYLPLTFDTDSNTLHTQDNKYCVGALASNNGAEVGLVRCNNVHKNAQWKSLSSTNQWKNGYSLCLDYSSAADSMIQNTCQTEPAIGSMQVYTFTGDKIHVPCPQPPPPPPPAQTQSCGSWSVSLGGPVNSCGAGYTYTAGNSDTCAADGSNCRSVCCSPSYVPPPPQQQSCGAWAVKYGGSPNCCGSSMIYTASDSTTCNADGSNCQSQCCSNKLY